jgi:CheY-like chemotaxis protein
MYSLAVIIDDDPISILVCETLLRKQNFVEEIKSFKNGDEGLEYLRERYASGKSSPNFIFLDVQMPVMNGWEFLEAYESLESLPNRESHIVMLSAAFDPADTLRAESNPLVLKFLAKPITSEALENLRAGV